MACAGKESGSFETNPEVLEKNGRHEETRTPDLYRVNLASLDFTTTYNCVGTA
jgi:hypothetical protein